MSVATLIFGCLAPLCLFVATLFQTVSALDLTYCSDINTATRPGNFSIYQSNGLCHDFCVGSYAFAILQDSQCWCSNYAPGSSESSSSCDMSCPGFPDDLCGGTGVYGYFALDKSPSGTQASSGTGATSKPQQVTVTAPARTVMDTDRDSSQITSAPSSSSTSDSSSSSLTWTPVPITSVETVTGQVRVITITPTAPPDNKKQESTGSGFSTGQAVGLTVGLVALASIIGVLIFFFVRRRRQQKEAEAARSGSSLNGGPTPHRTMSENSRYMLGTDGRRVVEGWEGDADTPVSAGSRRSRLMPVDPRLDPFAPVYQRGDGSKSRDSVQTIQDNHDYSRRVHQTAPILRATNPDTGED